MSALNVLSVIEAESYLSNEPWQQDPGELSTSQARENLSNIPFQPPSGSGSGGEGGCFRNHFPGALPTQGRCWEQDLPYLPGGLHSLLSQAQCSAATPLGAPGEHTPSVTGRSCGFRHTDTFSGGWNLWQPESEPGSDFLEPRIPWGHSPLLGTIILQDCLGSS